MYLLQQYQTLHNAFVTEEEKKKRQTFTSHYYFTDLGVESILLNIHIKVEKKEMKKTLSIPKIPIHHSSCAEGVKVHVGAILSYFLIRPRLSLTHKLCNGED